MDFVQNLGDSSGILEIAIGGVGRAEIIDNCLVRVTFFKPPTDGETIRQPVCQLIWTIPAWLAARVALHDIAMEIARLGLPESAGIKDVSLARH